MDFPMFKLDHSSKLNQNLPEPIMSDSGSLSDAICGAARDLQVKFDQVKEEVKHHLCDTKKMLNTVLKGMDAEEKPPIPPTKRDKIFRGFEQAKYLTHQSLTYNKEEIRAVFDYIIKQTQILYNDHKISKELQVSLEKELEIVYGRAEQYITNAQIKINESLCLLQQQSINALIQVDNILKNASQEFNKIKDFHLRPDGFTKVAEPDINVIHKKSSKIKKTKL